MSAAYAVTPSAMVPSWTSTVTDAGSTAAAVGPPPWSASAVPLSIAPKKALISAGFVASASLFVDVSGPVVGSVSKVMFPDERLAICSAKLSTEKPLSNTTERLTASTRSDSFAGLVSVPTDRILLTAPDRKAC